MTRVNPRTGRYSDDLFAKLRDGTATFGDVRAHAQEIIVEAPEEWGTVVTEPVRLLLAAIDLMNHALDVPDGMLARDLDEEHAGL